MKSQPLSILLLLALIVAQLGHAPLQMLTAAHVRPAALSPWHTTSAAAAFPDACGDQTGGSQLHKRYLPLTMQAAGSMGTRSASRLAAPPPALLRAADPAVTAPPLDDSVATDFATATAFLYTGPNPIQTGVRPGTIDPKRVAVLRGTVSTRDGTPLAGVRIRIFDHGEYGQTLSRADGMFDLAVNGGGELTVCYEQAGYLPLHRKVQTPWRDYAWLPEVVLLPLDPQVTMIDLASSAPVQVARGSQVVDEDGTRQATLLFAQGTTAEMVMPDGSTRPISSLSVRATEYTVGENGPEAMPGELPANSGYTYAVEFSVDEALAAGATDVRFDRPVINYLENFLDFPVGMAVPTGYYDRAQGVWVPSDNGRVIAVLSESGGLAVLDVDGSGQAASAQALAALGITDAERRQLASLYQPGQSLWRVPIPHFTPWDDNWPYGPPDDATPPNQPPPQIDPPEPDSCEQEASIIECQNQVLGERLAIAGTPFTLNYRSNRVLGRVATRSLDITLSGATVPASLAGIALEVAVGGRQFTERFPPAPNQRHRLIWDGLDGYGRRLQGEQPVTVGIGYVYPAVYLEPDEFFNSFARFGGTPITGSRARQEITIWQEWKGRRGLTPWDARGQGLGGWTLGEHHSYDPAGQMLRLGDGRLRRAADLPAIITTVAGNGQPCSFSPTECGDGGPASDAQLLDPSGLAIGPDGSLYISIEGGGINARVRRVGPDGIITTVAGGGFPADGLGDGGPATAARLNVPTDVAVAPDGSLYIADSAGVGGARIRRVGPDGIITTVAGGGDPPDDLGDGGPATAALIGRQRDIALGPDGSIYIAEDSRGRVRKVGTDGIITTVAGGGDYPDPGDGGPATEAWLDNPWEIAVGPDGSLYIGVVNTGFTGARVRRVGPDGIITTVAGGGGCSHPSWCPGDGSPATEASLYGVTALITGSDGTLYIGDGSRSREAGRDGARVRIVRPDGIIVAEAGTGASSVAAGDWGPALQAEFYLNDLVLDPDGALYIADTRNNRIRKVASPLPGASLGDITIAAEDGSEIYHFDYAGRHLRTVHALTGAALYSFSYDSAGLLRAVEDGNGNITTIQHDANGNPTAIVGPYGQRTTLAVDANGYLAAITNPAGETHAVTYHGEGGLLATFTDPRGNVSRMSYDEQGRLVRDEAPDGSVWELARSESGDDYSVTLTGSEGRATTYQVEELATGDRRRVNTFPGGTQTEAVLGADGSQAITYPAGAGVTSALDADPRWGMQSPVMASTILTTPGGIDYRQEIERSVALADEDDLSSLQTMTDTVTINGRTSTVVYDATSRTVRTTSPAGRGVAEALDEHGRVTRTQVAALEPFVTTYDARGRPATTAQGDDAQARRMTLAYTTNGYLEQLTDPLGRQTTFGYDTAGRVTQRTRPDGSAVQFGYDANGNLTTLTPPGRSGHAYTYTAGDRLAEYIPPDIGAGAGRISYSYNADGQVIQETRSDDAIDYAYDSAGRLTTIATPRGPLTYSYAATTGQLATVTSPDAPALAFDYDGHLPTATTWSGTISGSVGQTYDDDLRIASQSVNGTQSISFGYDADGLLIQAGALAVSRDAQTGFVSGTTLGSIADSVNYNGFGEPVATSAAFNGAALYGATYTYDQLGRIASKTETIGGTTTSYDYAYDLAGRLAEVTRDGTTLARYTYDANGNRLTTSGPGGTIAATYDAQDRLTSSGATSYSYTAHGELLAKTSAGQTTGYDYDELGNLLGVTLPDGRQIDYLVDGLNRRVGKRIDGVLVQGWLYQDSLKPIAELDGSGAVVSRFVYGVRSNVPAYMLRGSATYRILTDHLDSPRLVVNSASGEVVQRLDYDAFGAVTQDTNPGFQPFGFAGGLYDPDTGLTRFGARDYDAETGRWTAKYPLGFGGGDTNLYAYVGNDPVNVTDPTGTNFSTWIQAAGLALGILFGGDQGVGTGKPIGPRPNPHEPTQTDSKPKPKKGGGGGGANCLQIIFLNFGLCEIVPEAPDCIRRGYYPEGA